MRVLPVYRTERPLEDAAQGILLGEAYSDAQFGAIKDQLTASPPGPFSASGSINNAVVRLSLLEHELQVANGSNSPDLQELERALEAALAKSPASSFLWLAQCWIKHLRAGVASYDLQLLNMSYRTGPNEAWIALKRNPLALSAFPTLPEKLAEQALSEFAGLVRSGLYADAAKILAGSGWPVRDKLLGRLAQVPEGDRRQFAHALEAKNLEGVAVPGVEERPRRPF